MAEQHFNDIYRTCSDLKSILENIATSSDIKHVSYYVSQANEHIEDIQQLVSTLYMILLNKQDIATAMKINMNRMISDFDDDEEE